MATITVSRLSWGNVAVIREGSSYQAVLHPTHIAGVLDVIERKCSSYVFTDEQRYEWKASLNLDNMLVLRDIVYGSQFVLDPYLFKERVQ